MPGNSSRPPPGAGYSRAIQLALACPHGSEVARKCRHCNRERVYAWAKANPERFAEHKRRYYLKNKEKFNKRSTESTRVYKYGVAPERYLEMCDAAGWKCQICQGELDQNRPARNRIYAACVDHCHKTGKVRGILCSRCNTALGGFRDQPEYLEAAIRYLQLSNVPG